MPSSRASQAVDLSTARMNPRAWEAFRERSHDVRGRGLRGSPFLDFESDVEAVLRIRQRYALHLWDRQCDAERVDDENERSGELPLHTGRTHTGIDSQAPRQRPVEVNAPVRGAEVQRRPQVEILVCQREPEDGRSVQVDFPAAE